MIKFGEKFALFLVALLTAGFYGAVVLFQFQWWALVPSFIVLGALLYFIVSHAGVRHFFWWLYGFTELGLLLVFIVLEWPSGLVLVSALGVLSAVVIRKAASSRSVSCSVFGCIWFLRIYSSTYGFFSQHCYHHH